MIQEKSVDSLKTFLSSSKENFCIFVDSVDFEACKKAAELILDAQAKAIADETGDYGIKYGSDKDAYASKYAERALAGNRDYQRNLRGYEDAKKGIFDARTYATAEDAAAHFASEMANMRNIAETTGKENWETRASNATSDAVTAAKADLEARNSLTFGKHSTRSQLKTAKENNEAQLERRGITGSARGGTNRGASRRANRQGGFGGN